MSDTKMILQLPGAQLESIEQRGDSITLAFSRVNLIQEMESTFQDSLWTQAVKLTIGENELTGELPECPCEISGGDLVNNIFTYRDHAPLPIDWHGDTRCTLKVAGSNASFSIDGTFMQLEQIDHPRYIKHVNK
ncbi:MAG: hypothetical protein WBO34_03480 [Gammaproteobacteria bacterium]